MKRTIRNKSITIRHNSEFKNVLTNNIEPLTIIEISISETLLNMNLNLIPKTVHTLKFNYNLKNMPYDIPPNIKTIYFYEYYYLLEELPYTIENIEIHKGFNHPVDNLHHGLKSISFGWNFNQEINDLPTSLEKIVLGINFNQDINNLPSNVKFLYISNPNYDYDTIKKLPCSLIFLQLGVNEDYDIKFDSIESNNLNYISQFEKNYGKNDFTYSNTNYFKNYYFYN